MRAAFLAATIASLSTLAIAASAAPAPGNAPVRAAVEDLTAQLRPRLAGPVRLLVAELDDRTPNAAETGLGRALTGLLEASLSREPGVVLVEREKLASLSAEQRLSLFDPNGASRVGKLAAADLVLAGSVSELGESLTVNLRVVDVERARVVGAASADIPSSALRRAGTGDLAALQKGLDALEAALTAYGAHHVKENRVRWPARLEDLVPDYLDRLPDAGPGRWLYAAKTGRASHSTHPELRPTYPRLNLQGVLDDSTVQLLKEQAQEIRLRLANFCVEHNRGPDRLEQAMEMPPVPARLRGLPADLPDEAKAWEYDARSGEAKNAPMPEVKIRVDCGGSPERPSTPQAPPGATVFLTARSESFLAEETYADQALVDLPPGRGRFAGARTAVKADTPEARWLATDKGLLVRDRASGRERRLELTLPPWSKPLVSCLPAPGRVWCLDAAGRYLEIELAAYPVLSLRVSRAPLAVARPPRVAAGPEGLWALGDAGTLLFVPAADRSRGSSRLVVFALEGAPLAAPSSRPGRLTVGDASFDLSSLPKSGGDSWVYKRETTRPGQFLDSGVRLPGRVRTLTPAEARATLGP